MYEFFGQMTDYIHWVSPNRGMQGLLAAALAALALAALAAHFPGWFAPLGNELERRRWSPLARWLLAALYFSRALAVVACGVLLVAPLRTPIELLLVSRARPENSPPVELAALRTPRARDAGPLVDRLLARLQDEGAADWVEPLPTYQQRVRSVLLEELPRAEQLPLAGMLSPRNSQLPGWIVAAVEQSVVVYLLRVENVRAAFVAAEPARGREEGWPLVDDLLGERLNVVDLLPIEETPRIGRIIQARHEPASSELAIGLMIEGRFPDARPVQFTLRLLEGGSERERFTIAVPADAESRRVIQRSQPVAGVVLGTEAVITDVAGTIARRIEQVGPPTEIRLSEVAAADNRLRDLLAAAAAEDLFAELRAEIELLGWRLPQYGSLATDPASFLLLDTGKAWILAPSQATLDAVQARLVHPPAAEPGRAMVVKDGPATIFSWQSMPIGGGASISPSAAIVEQARPTGSLIEGRAATNNGPPAVLTGRIGTEPYVVISLGRTMRDLLPTGDATTPYTAAGDPAIAFALIRSLAWAAHFLRCEAHSTEAGERPAAESSLAAPVLNEADLQSLAAQRNQTRRALCLGVIGLAWLSWAWEVLAGRRTQRTNRSTHPIPAPIREAAYR